MKKILAFLLIMLVVPGLLCVIAHFINPRIVIGKGEDSLENHLMGRDIMIEVGGLYKNMDVEEYVMGVMSGVIPADYEIEALKVQAVLIRTNVLREMEEKSTKDAKDLSYRYLTKEERKEIWGVRQYDRNEKRLERAVADTAGIIVKQENKMIMALYHEVSIGRTADAAEVLDEDISYLKSVDSNQDVEAKNYLNVVEYDWKELSDLLDRNVGEKGEDDPDIKIAIEESSENGFVKKISINGTIYTGMEAMKLLLLPSINFYVEEKDEGVRFVCLGKGDCLGVSQYGANCMAANGSSMEDIIHYYYNNVTVKKVTDD